MSRINTLPKAHFFSKDIIGTSYKRNPLKKFKIFDFGQKVCRKLERNVPTTWCQQPLPRTQGTHRGFGVPKKL